MSVIFFYKLRLSRYVASCYLKFSIKRWYTAIIWRRECSCKTISLCILSLFNKCKKKTWNNYRCVTVCERTSRYFWDKRLMTDLFRACFQSSLLNGFLVDDWGRFHRLILAKMFILKNLAFGKHSRHFPLQLTTIPRTINRLKHFLFTNMGEQDFLAKDMYM